MKISTNRTLAVSIAARMEKINTCLADPYAYPKWGTTFFTGPVTPKGDGDFIAHIKMMGGATQFRINSDVNHGAFQLYFAPLGKKFGEPLEVRTIPNGDGADVLWTLTRAPKTNFISWRMGLFFMKVELKALKKQLETPDIQNPSL